MDFVQLFFVSIILKDLAKAIRDLNHRLLLYLRTIKWIRIYHIYFGEVRLIFVKTLEPILFIGFVIIFEFWILALLVILELILLIRHGNILN